MARRYVIGYGSQTVDLDGLRRSELFKHLHPEFQDRTLDMFEDDPTGLLGVGSSARTRERALQMYNDYKAGRRSAPAGHPDRTYHTIKRDGRCYAIDFVGPLSWMNRNAHVYGIRHFGNVNREPWHGQPIELPTACSASFQGTALRDWGDPVPDGGFPQTDPDPSPAAPPLPGLVENPAVGVFGLKPLDTGKPPIGPGTVNSVYAAYAKGVFRHQMFKLMYTIAVNHPGTPRADAAIHACDIMQNHLVMDGNYDDVMVLAVTRVQQVMGYVEDGRIGWKQMWPLIDAMSDGALF